MSELLKRHWSSKVAGTELPRRERRSCDYDAYLPDPLIGRAFVLAGDVAADVADAEAAITGLDSEATALADTEALARILLRAESVASSRIEGLEVGARRLLRAEAIRSMHEPSSDVTATEVLGNIDAMLYGLERIGRGDEITVELLLEIHRRLLAGTRHEAFGGSFREVQNWIGGNDYNPCSADFVPPPPELVRRADGRHRLFLQRRSAASGRARSDRPRAIRDDPSIRRWKRTHRTRNHPPGPPSKRACCPRSPACLARSCDTCARLRRRADGDSVRGTTELDGGSRCRESLDRDVRRRVHSLSRRRSRVRVAHGHAGAKLARAGGPRARQLGDGPVDSSSPRCTGPHGRERGGTDRTHLQARERGHPTPHRGGHPSPSHDWAAQPCLRGPGGHRCIHGSRASAREPRTRYASLATSQDRAAATTAAEGMTVSTASRGRRCGGRSQGPRP